MSRPLHLVLRYSSECYGGGYTYEDGSFELAGLESRDAFSSIQDRPPLSNEEEQLAINSVFGDVVEVSRQFTTYGGQYRCFVLRKEDLTRLGAFQGNNGLEIPIGEIKVSGANLVNEFSAMNSFGSQSPCRFYQLGATYTGVIPSLNGKQYQGVATLCQDPRDLNWQLREFRWNR